MAEDKSNDFKNVEVIASDPEGNRIDYSTIRGEQALLCADGSSMHMDFAAALAKADKSQIDWSVRKDGRHIPVSEAELEPVLKGMGAALGPAIKDRASLEAHTLVRDGVMSVSIDVEQGPLSAASAKVREIADKTR
ncbi:hypothetical protein MWN34_10630 [Ancylobacter sp. 6x-1]|uniref:Uncharacterized protein n=1 Tax=Ancylobacter crimeensis TaxID=2579147 RepID=A0ABT0DBM0_9HYPH|nr:hypothetical protein [Ancylobacter crimeensis]MCK0197367.1 hypothetical protein [Ancylobacter crimeensis]